MLARPFAPPTEVETRLQVLSMEFMTATGEILIEQFNLDKAQALETVGKILDRAKQNREANALLRGKTKVGAVRVVKPRKG